MLSISQTMWLLCSDDLWRCE